MDRTLRRARRAHSHQAWIEYRFLAERIRCAVFLAICGVEPQPLEVLPFMGHSQTANDWTVRVFDEIWNRLPRLTRCTQDQCPILNPYIRETWLGQQIRFHNGKAESEKRARQRLARAGDVVLPVSIAAAALHLALMAAITGRWEEVAHAMHSVLTLIALLFPAIAASLAGMEAHREHLRLQRRSENMAPQSAGKQRHAIRRAAGRAAICDRGAYAYELDRLNRQMASATDPARLETILRDVDELMLRETQDWLMLMRYVEIKAG
jgi:hypothetical protein